MAIVAYEVVIHAPAELVYEVSQDYAVRYEWDPFPERIELLDGAKCIGKGTKVLVLAKNGLKMEVIFVQVKPPATAAIKMTKGPFFLESFSGSWVFKAMGDGSTRARFVYSVKSKAWAFPLFLDGIIAWYFKGVVIRRLDSLKAYCERQVKA